MVGLNALSVLIENQEKTINESMLLINNLKKEKLPDIPIEYRDSYEQQFFEISDKENYQLRILQRYSSCLILFSFIENYLKRITLEFANKFNIPIKDQNYNIILGTVKTLISDIGVDEKLRSKEYNHIVQQIIVRNKIAHNNGVISKKDLSRFKKSNGCNVSNYGEIIIRPEYLKGIIDSGRVFFKNLILLIDDRYKDLSK